MLSPTLLTSRLISLYNSGKTDSEIARQAKCDHALINNLRHRRRRIERSSLELVLNLFPDIDKAIAAACQGKLGVTQVANGNSDCNINQTASDSSDLESYQLRLYRGLAGLDISDDAKAKVLALIQSAGEAR